MKKFLTILTFSFFIINVKAQNESKINIYDFNGYLSVIPSSFWNRDTIMWQMLLNNRLNFDWTPSKNISTSLQLRNQLFSGTFLNIKSQESGFKSENYYLPLTYIQNFNNNYLLSLSLDRCWVQYTSDKLEIKVGRQRINWGQTFVWSTNDIFNTFNFFESDYPERPGVDAIRLQYYTSNISSLDVATKIDSSGNLSFAGLYRFNILGYDFWIFQ